MNQYPEEFDLPPFLDPKKLKEQDDRIKNGEVKQCSIDNPDCEACGS